MFWRSSQNQVKITRYLNRYIIWKDKVRNDIKVDTYHKDIHVGLE